MPDDSDETHEVVEAKRFILRGPNGEKKAELSTGDDGQPGLQLFDESECPRLWLRLDKGMPVMQLLDAGNGTDVRVSLGMGENGAVALSFYNAELAGQLILGILSEAPARLFFCWMKTGSHGFSSPWVMSRPSQSMTNTEP